MTRRTLFCLAILVALVLPALATAAPPEGSLRLKSVATGGGETANGFFFTENLYARPSGRFVGTDRAVCAFRPPLGIFACRITANLPSGKLFIRLPLLPGDRGSFTVTGGTGRYQGRKGVGIYRSFPGHTNITIWLTSAPR
jgi:hypothetical protein